MDSAEDPWGAIISDYINKAAVPPELEGMLSALRGGDAAGLEETLECGYVSPLLLRRGNEVEALAHFRVARGRDDRGEAPSKTAAKPSAAKAPPPGAVSRDAPAVPAPPKRAVDAAAAVSAAPKKALKARRAVVLWDAAGPAEAPAQAKAAQASGGFSLGLEHKDAAKAEWKMMQVRCQGRSTGSPQEQGRVRIYPKPAGRVCRAFLPTRMPAGLAVARSRTRPLECGFGRSTNPRPKGAVQIEKLSGRPSCKVSLAVKASLQCHLQGLYEGPFQAPTQGSLPETRVRALTGSLHRSSHGMPCGLIEGPFKQPSEGPPRERHRGAGSRVTVQGTVEGPPSKRRSQRTCRGTVQETAQRKLSKGPPKRPSEGPFEGPSKRPSEGPSTGPSQRTRRGPVET
ncbi:hypothetical protein M885DRAFT_214373 [Pelagophyceae sp. CCMP2097]|nr:hypothetical protein M885DRAFT_214373 [Pelagophyceae sp. CCMP2097]